MEETKFERKMKSEWIEILKIYQNLFWPMSRLTKYVMYLTVAKEENGDDGKLGD